MMDNSVALDERPPDTAACSLKEPLGHEESPLGRRRAVYVKNLAQLYRRQQALAVRLEAVPFSSCPALERTRDGRFTAQLPTANGRAVYLHSRYRPIEEAQQFVEAQSRAEDGADGARAPGAFLLCGIGLGYHLAELLRRHEVARVIVAEQDLALIKAALTVVDISNELHEGRVFFLTSAEKSHVHEVLRPANIDIMLGLKVIALPYATQHRAEFHSQARSALQDFICYARLQMVTVLRNARITCKNILFNLPAYLARPGVEVLRNRAAGYPAILVAAGPSLARNIDQLAGLRERAVIIAVQTVFKQLLARGIPPHFVTSLDFHEISAQFFQGVEDLRDCILVAEPKAAWQVLEAYRGRTHVLHNNLCDVVLGPAAPVRGRLKAGSTVAHLSFYLAEYLGCDPIILIGQDLSFSDGLYYPPGLPIEQTWAPELNRFYTVEMKQWERIVRARPILRTVTDVHGRKTYTDDQLFTYAEQFQTDFAHTRARVIHACEGGMRLAGTEPMRLREAGERFCTRPLPADLFAAGGDPLSRELQVQAQEAIEKRLADVGEVAEIARTMRGLLDELAERVDRPAEFNKLVPKVDELRVRLRRYEQTYGMVVGVSQVAELRRYSADRRLRAQQHEDADAVRQSLARDREFVSAFMDGCEFLMQVLPQAMRRLGEGGR